MALLVEGKGRYKAALVPAHTGLLVLFLAISITGCVSRPAEVPRASESPSDAWPREARVLDYLRYIQRTSGTPVLYPRLHALTATMSTPDPQIHLVGESDPMSQGLATIILGLNGYVLTSEVAADGRDVIRVFTIGCSEDLQGWGTIVTHVLRPESEERFAAQTRLGALVRDVSDSRLSFVVHPEAILIRGERTTVAALVAHLTP